jgi:hypothetical protein
MFWSSCGDFDSLIADKKCWRPVRE